MVRYIILENDSGITRYTWITALDLIMLLQIAVWTSILWRSWPEQEDYTGEKFSISACIANCKKEEISIHQRRREPVPLAMRSKAQVFGHSPAEIVGSNPTGDMDVSLL